MSTRSMASYMDVNANFLHDAQLHDYTGEPVQPSFKHAGKVAAEALLGEERAQAAGRFLGRVARRAWSAVRAVPRALDAVGEAVAAKLEATPERIAEGIGYIVGRTSIAYEGHRAQIYAERHNLDLLFLHGDEEKGLQGIDVNMDAVSDVMWAELDMQTVPEASVSNTPSWAAETAALNVVRSGEPMAV